MCDGIHVVVCECVVGSVAYTSTVDVDTVDTSAAYIYTYKYMSTGEAVQRSSGACEKATEADINERRTPT